MASGVDTLTTGPGPAASPSAPKRNALPHEVAVDVTGARPGADPSKRELFAESTTSVLAFENGGVLRLAADVAVGQLLFLTLVATKREVVAQVTRKHPLGTGFVEVEFTEPSPGFWGIDLQSQPPGSAPAAALRQAVEQTATQTASAPSLPNAEEVQRLKSEVAALREHPEPVKLKPGASAGPSAPANEDAQTAPAPSIAKVASVVEPTPPNAAPLSASAEPAEPHEPDKKEFAAQDLLPKAALDFSRADAAATLAPKKTELSRKPRGPGNLPWLVLGAAIPATIFGALWYGGFIPGFGRASAQSAKGAAVELHSAAAKPATAAPQNLAPTRGSHSAAAQANPAPAGIANDSTAKVADAPSASPLAGGAAEPISPDPPTKSPNPASSRQEEVDRSNDAEKSAEKSSTVRQAVVKVPLDDAGDVVPPKLLQSFRAVAPPDAIRSFATGNVVLDALVDSTGQIQSSKVISGPQVLRDAAISALKQYKYAPATQHGKPVDAHVQVTVQFWYEP